MPTTTGVTAKGTAYTAHQDELPVHGKYQWMCADAHASDANIPTILYFHGSQADYNQFETLPAWKLMRDWVMDMGLAVVEGVGGAATGTFNWGNQAARDAYPAYLEAAGTQFDIGVIGTLLRSMGALAGLYVSTQSDIADDIDFIINNSGVSTMLVGTEVNAPADATDPQKAAAKLLQCSAFYFGQPAREAYGASSYAAFKSYLLGDGAQFCPENWPTSVWDGRKILNCYGTADAAVPWSPRGAKTLRDIWNGHPAIDQTSVRQGGTHLADNGSYLDTAAMQPFILDRIGLEPPPPEQNTYLEVVGDPFMVINGRRYEISPDPMGV